MFSFLIAFLALAMMPQGSPGDLLQLVDDIRVPGTDFKFDLNITSVSASKKETRQRFSVFVRDGKKSLVKFTDPPEFRGRVLLMVGQDTWIYIPTTSQPVRISPQQRLMGPISNGDVARVALNFDYRINAVVPDRIDGRQYNRLELAPRTELSTYGKILLWIEADTNRPFRAQFFAESGKLLKTASYKGYSLVLGKQRPLITEVEDNVRLGERSIMEFSGFQVTRTPDNYFDKDNLRLLR
jgi:hypothetical protein